MFIAFGNTWDNFIYFLYKFQSVFRRGAINNSNYIFMSWNANFNEKRLSNICVRNIKLWQDEKFWSIKSPTPPPILLAQWLLTKL